MIKTLDHLRWKQWFLKKTETEGTIVYLVLVDSMVHRYFNYQEID